MPPAIASLGEAKWTGLPFSSTTPESGLWTRVITLISVDLPAPFSPSSAWIDPALSRRDTPSSAFTPGKPFVMSLSSRGNVVSSTRVVVVMSGRPECANFAVAVEADCPEDENTQQQLHIKGVDREQHERLGDQGDDDDAQHRADHADMPAGECGTTDDRGREGGDQPVVPDRRLP